jgi:hypothetical protein
MNSLIISGGALKDIASSCFIYIWRRASGECLYIGQSRTGLRRLVAPHHVIGKASPIADDDTFEINYYEEDEIDSVERQLIKIEKPRFNTQTEEYRAKITEIRNRGKIKPQKKKVKWYWDGPKWTWRYID